MSRSSRSVLYVIAIMVHQRCVGYSTAGHVMCAQSCQIIASAGAAHRRWKSTDSYNSGGKYTARGHDSLGSSGISTQLKLVHTTGALNHSLAYQTRIQTRVMIWELIANTILQVC